MYKAFTLFAFFLWAPPVYAYLDPGTGSMLVQGLIAAFAATVTTLGLYRERVKAFFSRKGTSDTTESPPIDANQEDNGK